MSGVPLWSWLQILWRYGRFIQWRVYWCRVLFITLMSFINAFAMFLVWKKNNKIIKGKKERKKESKQKVKSCLSSCKGIPLFFLLLFYCSEEQWVISVPPFPLFLIFPDSWGKAVHY